MSELVEFCSLTIKLGTSNIALPFHFVPSTCNASGVVIIVLYMIGEPVSLPIPTTFFSPSKTSPFLNEYFNIKEACLEPLGESSIGFVPVASKSSLKIYFAITFYLLNFLYAKYPITNAPKTNNLPIGLDLIPQPLFEYFIPNFS